MPGIYDTLLKGVSSCWKSPSNIALIKYWGKKGVQLPANPSISITLEEAYTITRVKALPAINPGKGPEVSFRFEGSENPAFSVKIEAFLKAIQPHFGFLDKVALQIESGNNFPHSAGIASSASGMSALALCLCSIEKELSDTPLDDVAFTRKASFISRIGSGSACRSVYGNFAVWGKHADLDGSDDELAIPLPFEPHPGMMNIHDAILIVDPSIKKVSSKIGHGLMTGHIFAKARYNQARANMTEILTAIQSGDWENFARITENEALTLHAMMMSSNPGFILMHANSLAIIDKIVNYRKQSGLKVCFTLDAGPNIHLLYPDSESAEVKVLIEDLKENCYNRTVIEDKMGNGPVKLNCR